MGELLFLGLIMAICGVFFYLTFDFQVSLLDHSGGAAMWPRIIIAFLMIFVIRVPGCIPRQNRNYGREP